MSNRTDKREQFSSTTSSKSRWLALSIGAAIAIALIAYVVLAGPASSASSTPKVTAQNGIVRIPLAQIGPTASFFEYQTEKNTNVRFFVMKSSDGVYRAAADACEVCYRDKQGYQQQGDDMVCRKCGQHFASKDVNEVTGGCNPSAIHRTIQGDSLLIAAADLEAHSGLF
ncbi:MAG TPA: DUF2318 domain-containing protein [Clostridia bacterium]|nr:DUF2318 domain-containing protein [Clostridia bacterium]